MTTPRNGFSFPRHALALALALAISPANAATINVSGSCTLINAINNANTDSDTDGADGCQAGSGADIVNLKSNRFYTLSSVNNLNFGPNGLPLITSIITINGNGATIRRSNTVNTPDFRLLNIAANGDLTLNNLTLSGGKINRDGLETFYYGGAIANQGTLTLNGSTVSGNSAVGVNGTCSGIANDFAATLTLNDSTVSGNSATRGGAIINFRGNTKLNNSTVSNNRAIKGGVAGIVNIDSSTMTLTNSTVSGNSSPDSTQYGIGGMRNSGILMLIHSTIANNRIAHGLVAGLENNGKLILTNSLIANSTGGADCFSSPTAIILRGTNLIEDGTCNAPLSGDPKLLPLLDNGGATLTHSLRKVSPVINIANTQCKSIDQRRVKRPQPVGGLCDMGAFERIDSIPAPMQTLLSFFDTQVANGGIVGIGSKASQKPYAIRNQLLAAGSFKPIQACGQLSKTLTRLDADNTPDGNDYVTGSQVAELITQINGLRTSWQCP